MRPPSLINILDGHTFSTKNFNWIPKIEKNRYDKGQSKKSMTEKHPGKKTRKPVVAFLLSLVSMGLGQVYNGELFKGILLKAAMFFSLCTFAILVFKTSEELLQWSAVLILFLVLKFYSMIQAFTRSRLLRENYKLRKFNNVPFYVLLTVFFLALNVTLPLWIAKFSLTEITPYHPFRSAKAKQRYLAFYDDMAKKWPVDSETRMVDTAHGRTFVRISGPKNAPPLVLMHGANATSLSWIPNIKQLSESYRTFAVDNIYDFGRSVFTKTFKKPEDYVVWMEELFAALDLNKSINLIGMSYGGWLTSQYTLEHPERLEKIVLIAPAATVLPLGIGFLKPALISILPHRHFVEEGIKIILEDAWIKDATTRSFAQAWVTHLDLGLRSFKPKMMVSPTVLSDEDLGNLDMSVLFLVGENEKIYSAEEAVARLENVAPHVHTKIIPGAGHDLTVVQAEMVNRIILDFLEKKENP
jgi:pimeloyl-ACP methyl ester carboxylesterase/TM2 domain-containing membrane protein YozV